MADTYATEQNLQLANELLKRQGEINRLIEENDRLRAENEDLRNGLPPFDSLRTILQQQLDLQRTYDTDPTQMRGDDRIHWFITMIVACEDELHEALNEVGWKPWTSSRHIDEDKAFNELRDALQFLINAMFTMKQITPVQMTDLIRNAMRDKIAINRNRDALGYTGVNEKCKKCKRALDEISDTHVFTNESATVTLVRCTCGTDTVFTNSA